MIMEAARAMLHDQGIPMHLWVEAARAAVHNRTRHRVVDAFVTSECIHLYILYIVFLCTPMFLSGESLM